MQPFALLATNTTRTGARSSTSLPGGACARRGCGTLRWWVFCSTGTSFQSLRRPIPFTSHFSTEIIRQTYLLGTLAQQNTSLIYGLSAGNARAHKLHPPVQIAPVKAFCPSARVSLSPLLYSIVFYLSTYYGSILWE